MNMHAKDYDVVIIGGGMVGACCACALGASHLRVALVDEGEVPEALPVDSDIRVSAVTLASRNIFRALAAWEAIPQERIAPLRAMRIRDSRGSAVVEFDSADIAEPELGYILENSVMRYAWYQRLRVLGTVDIISADALEALECDLEGVAITTRQGLTLRARLVIGADGAQSHLRELAGMGTRGWDFAQQGIVATVQTTVPHQAWAQQVFLSSGPLAFLPLTQADRCSIVWSADTARAQALLALEEDAFLRELEEAVAQRMGNIHLLSPRQGFPLSLMHAPDYVRPRIALIGDAAHRVHPLAGQGVNLGYADAASLAQIVLQAAREDKDIGAVAVLRRYERWRKGDNVAMLALTDGLKRLFAVDQPAVVGLRNIGMSVTQRLTPVKRKLMRLASGLDGDLPLLARGQSLG